MIELAFEGYQPAVQPGHIVVSAMWMPDTVSSVYGCC
jgi:sorbitol-specific phosphotransferase system component IIA